MRIAFSIVARKLLELRFPCRSHWRLSPWRPRLLLFEFLFDAAQNLTEGFHMIDEPTVQITCKVHVPHNLLNMEELHINLNKTIKGP